MEVSCWSWSWLCSIVLSKSMIWSGLERCDTRMLEVAEIRTIFIAAGVRQAGKVRCQRWREIKGGNKGKG